MSDSDWQLNTAVAFIIFNRPDTTERVFAEIAKAKPPKLLVIADGPRLDRPGEAEKCHAARAIIERVDWPCEVLTNYSETNLGCKNRVASGLDWVFEQVPEAIILEDDCLPEPSFFRFCEELLDRYRDDERIALISGDNFQFGKKYGESSYYFSMYNHIWGWASWRRAWRYYDKDIRNWPKLRDSGWLKIQAQSIRQREYWQHAFQGVYTGKIDTWDYQWTFTVWSQNMISILPNVNLISNIGFGSDATHTTSINIYSNMKTQSIEFPLCHPNGFDIELKADAFTGRNMFSISLFNMLSRVIRRIFKK
ncbi:MAG: hemolytic protein HlpA-like protein [Methylomonas sp.]|nr:MAG: hemolytic protein HlpA-like protein [Methylomonas sp.]